VEGADGLMSDLAAGFNTLAASAISVGSMAALESDVLVATQTSTLFSSTWPTAALAMFFPTIIEQPLVVTQMTHVNGGTLAGTVTDERSKLRHAGVRELDLAMGAVR
jgi:hypothetical protein